MSNSSPGYIRLGANLLQEDTGHISQGHSFWGFPSKMTGSAFNEDGCYRTRPRFTYEG